MTWSRDGQAFSGSEIRVENPEIITVLKLFLSTCLSIVIELAFRIFLIIPVKAQNMQGLHRLLLFPGKLGTSLNLVGNRADHTPLQPFLPRV